MRPDELGHLAVTIGQRYIAAGGPTSRFEQKINAVGRMQELDIEAWSTGTGISVSVYTGEGYKTSTHMGRVHPGSVNLDEVLKLENFMNQMSEVKFAPQVAHKKLNAIPKLTRRLGYNFGALFVVGFAASYPFFHIISAALLSGLFVILSSTIAGPLAEKWRFSRIFCDFFATLATLVLSALMSLLLDLPVESMAIGVFVLLTPGTLLTNSVSELAEQHFLAGTVKLMKALLVLLAMGTAYLLSKDLAHYFDIHAILQTLKRPPQNFASDLLGVLTIVAAFSFILHVPLKLIPFSVFSGFLGWIVFYFIKSPETIILHTYLPALVLGSASLILGQIFKTPSQLFSIPGIISLVPGMLAFSIFLEGQNSNTQTAFQVAVVVGGLAFGLLSARIPFLLFRRRSLLESME